MRHLLARYDVSGSFDSAWTTGDDDPVAVAGRSWFVHVGQGANLRTADCLPVPLTKLMAHHVMAAPADITLAQALRYGQCRGLGLPDRASRAVIAARHGSTFGPPAVETFWLSVLQFFARHPMIDPNQIGPILDYLHHQRFAPAGAVLVNGTFVQQGPPQPGLCMRGRDPVTLVAQVSAWHRQLARRPRGSDFQWPPCGIPGYERVEGEPGNQRRFEVVELFGSAALRDEGAAMRHCVATYATSCRMGRAAIYAVRLTDGAGLRRMLTVEVDVRHRRIVQARGRCNAAATPLDVRILQAWATVAHLSFGACVLPRA